MDINNRMYFTMINICNCILNRYGLEKVKTAERFIKEDYGEDIYMYCNWGMQLLHPSKWIKRTISCQLCQVRQVCQAKKCLYIAVFPQKMKKNDCQLDGFSPLSFRCKLRIMVGICSAERISQIAFMWTDLVGQSNSVVKRDYYLIIGGSNSCHFTSLGQWFCHYAL